LNISWRRDADAWYATVVSPDGTIIHLTVERVPNETSWDWAVWKAGDDPDQGRHGVEPSAPAARSKAEARLD
jgi:hypothetical protein